MQKKYIFPILFFVLLTISYFCFKNHESHSLKKIEFVIEKPYLNLIRNLAKKDSLEKIIEKNGIEITNKKWHEFIVDVPDRVIRLRQYKLEGHFEFTVVKKDNYLGKLILPFEQKTLVDFQDLIIKTKLIKPNDFVTFCEKKIKIYPKNKMTAIEVSSEIKIKKFIPFMFEELMDKKVNEFNEQDINNFKENLINISGS